MKSVTALRVIIPLEIMKCSRLNPKSNVPFKGFHLAVFLDMQDVSFNVSVF